MSVDNLSHIMDTTHNFIPLCPCALIPSCTSHASCNLSLNVLSPLYSPIFLHSWPCILLCFHPCALEPSYPYTLKLSLVPWILVCSCPLAPSTIKVQKTILLVLKEIFIYNLTFLCSTEGAIIREQMSRRFQGQGNGKIGGQKGKNLGQNKDERVKGWQGKRVQGWEGTETGGWEDIRVKGHKSRRPWIYPWTTWELSMDRFGNVHGQSWRCQQTDLDTSTDCLGHVPGQTWTYPQTAFNDNYLSKQNVIWNFLFKNLKYNK